MVGQPKTTSLKTNVFSSRQDQAFHASMGYPFVHGPSLDSSSDLSTALTTQMIRSLQQKQKMSLGDGIQ